MDGNLFTQLAKVLPSLKSPLQILGLLIIIGGVIAYRTVPPEYVKGVFAAGSMGIFFLIFGQLFSALPSFPEAQRGYVVVAITIVFSFFTLGAIALTAYFVVNAAPREIPLRRFGQLVKPASQADVNSIVRYIEDTGKCDFTIKDVQEAQLVIDTIRDSKTSSDDEVQFVKSWDQEESELKDAVCRLVRSFSNTSLAASEFSEQWTAKTANDQSRAQGMVMYEGSDAQNSLIASMEKAETDPVRVTSDVESAASALIVVGYTNLYSRLRDVPQRDAEMVDEDFLKFTKNIPDEYFDIVKLAAFPNKAGDFIEFECDSPPGRDRKEDSYSRFIVPKSLIYRRAVLDQMEHGPWPVGQAQALFSEDWWLTNAVWQMLAREHGKYRENLGIRISDYAQCGPP